MNPFYTLVADRATHRREYCHAPELVFNFPFEPEFDTEVRLFHPRQDHWDDHFQVDSDSGTLAGKTSIGRVTIACLDMNSQAQVTARQLWIRLGLFP
jgi:hypothetical protein